MLIAPIIKKAAVLLTKLFILYLALIVLVIDFVLFKAAWQRFIFEQQPFIQSTVLSLVISATISMAIRSKNPIIFTALCLACSALFFVSYHQATSFIALFCALAAVNFLCKNKITEPFLVMLPIIAGAWIFITTVYPSYLLAWANYITGRKDFFDSIFEGLAAVKDQLVLTIIIIPVVFMYFLGKHSYVKLYSILKSLYSERVGKA